MSDSTQSNQWNRNLCDDCLNAHRYTQVCYTESASFYRKGVGYQNVAKCAVSGLLIYPAMNRVTKCSHFIEKKVGKK